MKFVLVGGPRDGVEMDIPNHLTAIKIPVPMHPAGLLREWEEVTYYRAPVRVAGVLVGEVFVCYGIRLSRAVAVQALTRLFLAGAFRQ